jgi:hypothetical protein
MNNGISPDTIIGHIYVKAIDLSEEKPGGINWKDLAETVQKAYPEFHPKKMRVRFLLV